MWWMAAPVALDAMSALSSKGAGDGFGGQMDQMYANAQAAQSDYVNLGKTAMAQWNAQGQPALNQMNQEAFGQGLTPFAQTQEGIVNQGVTNAQDKINAEDGLTSGARASMASGLGIEAAKARAGVEASDAQRKLGMQAGVMGDDMKVPGQEQLLANADKNGTDFFTKLGSSYQGLAENSYNNAGSAMSGLSNIFGQMAQKSIDKPGVAPASPSPGPGGIA